MAQQRERVHRLRSGFDPRSQDQRDRWTDLEWTEAVKANVKRRELPDDPFADDEPEYDGSTYHQHDGTFADSA